VRSLARYRQRSDRTSRGNPRVLAVVPEGPNRLALQELCAACGWELAFSDGKPADDSFRGPGVPSIVLYDRDLFPQLWREIVRSFAKSSPRPYIILLSSSAGANLRDELQRLGGAEILRTPIERDHLRWTLSQAWRLWSAQQRVRPPATAFTR